MCIFLLKQSDNKIFMKPDYEKIKMECFLYNTNVKGRTLEDISEDYRKPRKDQTIFFHIIDCWSKDEYLNLNSRQACAIESAAKNNPRLDVFVIFARPRLLPRIISNEIIALSKYRNIHFRSVNIWNYIKKSPANDWFNNETFFKSDFVLSHLTTLLRLTSLWIWGGIYMDDDVIVKGSFEEIPLNFVGLQEENLIGGSILGFDSEGFGHYAVDVLFKMFIEDFSKNSWVHNGPLRFTEVILNSVCNKSKRTISRLCEGLTIFPTKVLYPISIKKWHMLFEDRFNESKIQTKDSLVVKFWNQQSSEVKLKVGNTTLYNTLAKQYCPRVYSKLREYF